MAVDGSLPQVECLVDVWDVCRFHIVTEIKADDAQMQSVRVLAIPVVGSQWARIIVDFRGIQFSMAMPEIITLQRFLKLQVVGIGETVPPPLAVLTWADYWLSLSLNLYIFKFDNYNYKG